MEGVPRVHGAVSDALTGTMHLASDSTVRALPVPSTLISSLPSPLLRLVGNLPNKISRDEVLKSIVGKLGKGVVTDLRLSLDENKRPRGFGYVELKEESMVEGAIADLNGLDVGE